MSENATETLVPIKVIKRNDVELPLYPTKRLKGANKGSEYPSFVATTPEQKKLLLDFLGEEVWFDRVQSWWKTFCLNVVKEFTKEDGDVDWDQVWKALAELSCRGETFGEMLEHLFALQAKFMKAALEDGDKEAAKRYGKEYRELKEIYDAKRAAKAKKKAAGIEDPEDEPPAEAPALM